MQVLMTVSKQSQDGTAVPSNCSSILTPLGNVNQNLHETYQCQMEYSRELLMMGREAARNI
jgi:hypothetical protein